MTDARSAKNADRPPAPHADDRASIQAALAEIDYRLDDQAGYLIRRAHQRATLCFQEVLEGFDITPRQFAALVTVLQKGEVSQNLLGRLTSMDPATIKGVVSRLCAAGLMDRLRSDSDKRLAIVCLTEKGVDFALTIIRRGKAVSRRILEPLAPDERDTFLTLLRKVS